MINKEKYEGIFIEMFGIEKKDLEGLEYNAIQQWDSVGHMRLMAALEESFDVMLEMDEIIGFSSYKKGIEILGKHGINILG